MARPSLVFTVFAPIFLLWSTMGSDCASDGTGDDDSTGGCTARSGTFTAHYSERSGGTCGPVQDQTAGDPTADAMCTGSATDSDDRCTTTIDETCTGADGSPYHETGTATWGADGTTGTAALTYVIYDNGADQPATCTSIYDVTYTKQVATTPPTQ